MMHISIPGWLQRATTPTARQQKYRNWRSLLWAGPLTVVLALALQPATAGVLLAADTVAMSEPWRFVDESKPGSPMITGELVTVAENLPTQENGTQVAARFSLNSTMQALALQLHDVDLGGLPLAHLEELGYCTRLIDGPRPYAVTLQVNVDTDVTDDNNGWQGRLVYTPSYNGAVIQGEWQCWNTLVGVWWATGGPLTEYAPVDKPQPLGTLLARFPNLGINASYNAITLKAGDGWSHFEGEAMPVVIGVEGERMNVAFGAAPQENVVLLPVLLNGEAPQTPQNEADKNEDDNKDDKKEKKQEEKEKRKEEKKEEKQNEWRGVAWGDIDWASFDWSKVDWEHLNWGVFAWHGPERAEEIRAFVADVQQCKDDGWQAAGFNNAGDCVAYYVEAHTPEDFDWDDFDWDNFSWNGADWNNFEWNRDWNNGNGRHNRDNDRNDRGRRNRDD